MQPQPSTASCLETGKAQAMHRPVAAAAREHNRLAYKEVDHDSHEMNSKRTLRGSLVEEDVVAFR